MRSNTRNQYCNLLSLAVCATLFGVACEPDKSNGVNQDICKTAIDNATSPAPGALTMHGAFYANETVILKYTDANHETHQASGTPATDRSSFTLTGLPSGTNTYSIVISCAAGQENNGSRNFTID